jgi:hypothetical protein
MTSDDRGRHNENGENGQEKIDKNEVGENTPTTEKGPDQPSDDDD